MPLRDEQILLVSSDASTSRRGHASTVDFCDLPMDYGAPKLKSPSAAHPNCVVALTLTPENWVGLKIVSGPRLPDTLVRRRLKRRRN
jgi:hypothetical protein